MEHICTIQPAASLVDVITAIYRPTASPSAVEAAAVIVNSSADLQRLLSAEGIDHTFLLQPVSSHSSVALQGPVRQPVEFTAAEAGASSHCQQQQQQQQGIQFHNFEAIFKEACMLWAYQGHARRSGDVKQVPGKLSVITFGAQRGPPCSPSGTSPMASAMLGMHRAFFMEERAAFGPAIDIWPPHHVPTQKASSLRHERGHQTLTAVEIGMQQQKSSIAIPFSRT